MDLSNSVATATVKTPEAENETPTRIQATNSKPLSFTNGVLKRHPPLQLYQANFSNHHHHPVVVNYKECLKNHAASLGRHAVDGCGEFMPSPTANPSEPTSLKCASCGCHRNFHRREPEDPIPPNAAPALEYQPHHRHHPPPPPPANRGNSSSGPNSPSPPPISSSYYPSAPHMLLALSHGPAGPPPESCGTPISTTPNSTSGPISSNPNGRKRFRTRFTQDQKDKMLHFAERVGWKMQKRDEDAITEFCSEIGVDKGVFKVWMHNNKTTFGRRDQPVSNSVISPTAPSTNNGNGNGIGYGTIGSTNNTFEASASASATPTAAAAAAAASVPYHHHHHHNHHPHHHQQDGNGDSKINIHGQDLSQHHLGDNSGNSPRHVLGTNGSSSSS